MKLLAALLLSCAIATTATAGPKTAKVDPEKQAKAEKLFIDGQANYQQGKYLAAIELFKSAYELVRDPVYLFNIAQGYRKVADCVPAHEYYVKYLDAAPNAENKQKVSQWIFELRPCVDKAREREEDAARSAEEADKQRKEAAKPAPPPEPYETEVDRGAPYRMTGIALGGLGLLGVIVGVTYGIKGDGIQDDINARCSPPNTCLWDSPEIRGLHADGQSANTLAKVGYIGGAVLIGAGVGLYMFGHNRVETITVTPTAGGAAASAGFRF